MSTELSDDEDVADEAAAALVVEDATRLRQVPLNALPPKRPPGGGLPEGAIWTEHVRQLRLGDYMLRLDVASIHTALVAQPPALRLSRLARSGKRTRVQFVSTEKVRSPRQNPHPRPRTPGRSSAVPEARC